VRSRSYGKAEAMDERDPAASLVRESDGLAHKLDELDGHISDAEKAAARRREDLDPKPGDADGGDD
jgi:hypothetical protein